MAKILKRRLARHLAVDLPAGLVFALGLVVAAGWLLRVPSLVAPVAGSNAMVLATALGFMIAAVALVAADAREGRLRELAAPFATGLVLLGLAALVSHAFGLDVGLDLPDLHRGLSAPGGVPGRMPTSTAAAFVSTGLLLLSLARVRTRLGALASQALALVILSIALVSIISYDIGLEGLLPWYRASRMALHTALGFAVLAIALLALIARSRWYRHLYRAREDERIVALTFAILFLVALVSGAAGFVMTQRNTEASIRRQALASVGDRAEVLESLIDNRLMRARLAARGPLLAGALAAWNRRPGDAAAHATLKAHIESLLPLGFSGLAILDRRGEPIAQAGTLSDATRFSARLAGRDGAELVWHGGYLLRASTDVDVGTQAAGTVVTEQALEVLGRMQAASGALSIDAHWILCGAVSRRMACFPHRSDGKPRVVDYFVDGELAPVGRALAGDQGVVLGEDPVRGRILSAYGPVGGTGLATVLQLEMESVYAPLRGQFVQWRNWFIALVILGTLLVSGQVRPVARRLARSEREARARAAELAEREANVRQLYASLAEGILVLTPSGTITFANPKAERLFGYAPGELAGREVSLLIPEELRASFQAGTRRFIAEGTSNVLGRRDLAFAAVRKDGTRFELEFSLAEMRQGGDRLLVGAFRDVTERKAIERLKSEFVATVSHELRTPLTSITGALGVLRDGDAGELPADAREFVDMAHANSVRLAALVDDIIDTERIESGALVFRDERFELQPFLEEALRLYQAYAATHEVLFALDPGVPEVRLRGDRDRLMQVMANLLSNACKFSPAGSAVRLAAMREGDRMRVEVTDRGPGIPEAFRAHIFGKFAQADGSDTRRKGGTGLGLAISKAIVERMGGRIGFEMRPGVGTIFWFELALEK